VRLQRPRVSGHHRRRCRPGSAPKRSTRSDAARSSIATASGSPTGRALRCTGSPAILAGYATFPVLSVLK
jgi:hypothetical protein